MKQLTLKDWVCLVEDQVLEAKQAARRQQARQFGELPGMMLEKLWRQIKVTATAEQILLELMDVDHEAAQGGYCRGGERLFSYTLAWEDLATDRVDNLLAHEQLVVYRRTKTLLASLQAPGVREVL